MGRKKKVIPVEPQNDENEASDVKQSNDENGANDSGNTVLGASSNKVSGKSDKTQPVRSLVKKSKEFIADLKSMMEGIIEDEEDGNLPQSEKLTCQKLLLTISVKDKIFSEDQRSLAKGLLRRLEGDRKRRCRTGGDGNIIGSSRNSSIG